LSIIVSLFFSNSLSVFKLLLFFLLFLENFILSFFKFLSYFIVFFFSFFELFVYNSLQIFIFTSIAYSSKFTLSFRVFSFFFLEWSWQAKLPQNLHCFFLFIKLNLDPHTLQLFSSCSRIFLSSSSDNSFLKILSLKSTGSGSSNLLRLVLYCSSSFYITLILNSWAFSSL